MSTRSIIAVQYGDGFRGRYCHSDGYPEHNGRVLFDEVHAAGLGALSAFLSDDGRGAWGISFISPGFLSAPVEMPWDIDGGWGQFDRDGRSWDIDGGWGQFDRDYNHRVYRDRKGESPSSWITHADTDLWGTEWCYVASAGGMAVGVVRWNSESKTDSVQWLGFYGWSQTPEWGALSAKAYGEVLA